MAKKNRQANEPKQQNTQASRHAKKASAAVSTADARRGKTGSRAQTSRVGAPEANHEDPSSIGRFREPLLDNSARIQLGGVVVAVVGLVLLLAVLLPDSCGVLTTAVSDLLHTAFGLGGVVVPLCLIAWSISVFTDRSSIVPFRVLVGLLLITVSFVVCMGLATPGCSDNPSSLFNIFVLKDRGGYLGNGIAWVLLTMFGGPVGFLVAIGIGVIGLFVVGRDLVDSVHNFIDCHGPIGSSRGNGRRQDDRGNASFRQYSYENDYISPEYPDGYVPTALFDPERRRPQSIRSEIRGDFRPAAPRTTQIGFDIEAQESQFVPVPKSLIRGEVRNEPAPATTALEDAPNDSLEVRDAVVAADVIQTSISASPVHEGVADTGANGMKEMGADDLGLPVPPASIMRRRARRKQWWNEADDWTRDQFDPYDFGDGSIDHIVPGVLPGAPLYLEPANSPVVSAEHSSSEIQDLDTTSQAMQEVEPALNNPQSFAGFSAEPADSVKSDQFLPGEPCRVPEPAPVVSLPKKETPSEAKVQVKVQQSVGVVAGEEYRLPDPSILKRSPGGSFKARKTEGAERMAAELQSALNEFGVKAEVVDWVEGPTCTTYKIRPGEGVRVNKFTALEDDIARTLARTSVRIYAPVPGTSYVGIEVSNNDRQNVAFGDVLPCVTGGPLDFAVGLDANGTPVHSDLAKLPHLLIAGTTGSGKSVTVNSIVLSFLMRNSPDDVRLIMVDPKQVEFSEYNGIPHLVMPVVTDPRQAAAALQWGVTEMDRRYRLFSNLAVRDLLTYNAMVDSGNFEESAVQLTHLPSVVVVIDELADLMMVAKKDVEASIVRIAQLGRAAGIHLIIATQTPRADIVTGLIRANVANRIALRVSKGTDSRIIIDQNGAEKLLPHGDMLFLEAAWGDKPRRIQGCNITDAEKAQIISHLKAQPLPSQSCIMSPLPGNGAQLMLDTGVDVNEDSPSKTSNDDDPLAWEAARIVVENQLGSTSMIQRRMKLGYARAGRVMDMLEEMGVVGPARGSKPRDVLVRDLDELATLKNADSTLGE